MSINAEDLPEISETYDVTAVPFTVIVKGGKVLESISGSDASKVRGAVEKFAGTGATPASSAGAGIPPPLKAEPQRREKTSETNGDSADGGVTRDLSGYKPAEGEPQTAPDYSGGKEDREELNERLGKLVKAA